LESNGEGRENMYISGIFFHITQQVSVYLATYKNMKLTVVNSKRWGSYGTGCGGKSMVSNMGMYWWYRMDFEVSVY